MRSFAEQISDIKANNSQVYATRTIDLSTARSNEEFSVAGNYFIILDATDLNANIQIRFNTLAADQLTFKKRQGVEVPFYRLFITNSAQAGKTITLIYGINDTPLKIVDQSSVFDINSVAHQESNGVNLYNKTCVAAATEYSQALPANTKKLTVKARGGAAQVCYTSGQSGTTYIYLADGQAMSEDLLYLNGVTLYFQSPTAGAVVEIVAWS